MKVVILVGGIGTPFIGRNRNQTEAIGGNRRRTYPYIMKIYSSYGFNDFVICRGYKGYLIKEFFANYFLHKSDVIIDLAANAVKVLDSQVELWKITLIDIGAEKP
jgi:glucose-1-phosphate cytidylyltransferase